MKTVPKCMEPWVPLPRWQVRLRAVAGRIWPRYECLVCHRRFLSLSGWWDYWRWNYRPEYCSRACCDREMEILEAQRTLKA